MLSTQSDAAMAFRTKVYALRPFTSPFNGTAQPPISLPMHLSDDGLPVGVQSGGRSAEYALLLRVAARRKEARTWFDHKLHMVTPEPALA